MAESGTKTERQGGEPKGTLEIAMEHAAFLLEADPGLAEEQAREILRVFPREARAFVVLAKALRKRGDAEGAKAAADSAVEIDETFAEAHVERGLALAAVGEGKQAIKAFERALSLEPEFTNAWRALGDQLTLAGDGAGADRAYARHGKLPVKDRG